LLVAIVSDLAALGSFVAAPFLGSMIHSGIAGPVEEGAICVNQAVEPIDQNADRQAIEN
jgi:hypothetical protein